MVAGWGTMVKYRLSTKEPRNFVTESVQTIGILRMAPFPS